MTNIQALDEQTNRVTVNGGVIGRKPENTVLTCGLEGEVNARPIAPVEWMDLSCRRV